MILLFILLIVVIDQAVKFWVVQYVSTSAPVILVPNFLEITYHENRGAAFSLLQNQIVFFVIVTVIVLAAIFYAFHKKLIHTPLGRAALALIAGGAVGNFADRIFRGFVVDMFYLSRINFPIFNIADICIVLGGIIFAYYIIVQHDRIANDNSEESDSL